MFKNKKMSMAPEPKGPELPKVFVDNEVPGGPGTVFLAGNSAAWAQSFKIKRANEAPPPASKPRRTSRWVKEEETNTLQLVDDGAEAEEDDDLLNPSIDEAAWNSDWYIEKASSQDAAAALKDKPDGMFVIRDSASEPGSFAISFRHNGTTNHALIHNTPNGLQLSNASATFACLSDLVFHYSQRWTPAEALPCALDAQLRVDLPQAPGSPAGTIDRKATQLGSRWTVEDVRKWLTHIGVENSANILVENKVNGFKLFSLTSDAFDAMSVPSSDSKKILQELMVLKSKLGNSDSERSSHEDSGKLGAETGHDLAAVRLGSDGLIQAEAPAPAATLKKRAPPPPPVGTYDRASPQPNPTASASASASASLNTPPPLPGNGVASPKFPPRASMAAVPSVNVSPASPSAHRVSFCGACGGRQEAGDAKCSECGPKSGAAPGNAIARPPPVPGPSPNIPCRLLAGDEARRDSHSSMISLRSILKISTAKKGLNVRFNESSIADSRQELKTARGIHALLDENAKEAVYYLGPVLRNQAAEKLDRAPEGAFVIFDSLASNDTLYLLHICGGEPVHTIIEEAPLGIHLKRSKQYFQCVSDLVEYYCSDNEEDPNMLNLQATVFALTGEVYEQQRSPAPARRVTAAVVLVDDRAHLTAPWYRGKLSDDDAVELIEFEPSGSFVVCDRIESVEYALTYVHQGRTRTVTILKEAAGYRLREASQVYPSMVALVQAYNKEAKDGFVCMLRLPNAPVAPVVTAASVDAFEDKSNSAPGSHEWLRLDMTKAQAIDFVFDSVTGTFVVRGSESRKGCHVLTYRFQDQAFHELIMQRGGKSPGFFLEIAPQKDFGSLEDLIAYFEQPRPELKCALVPPEEPSAGRLHRRGTAFPRSDGRASNTSEDMLTVASAIDPLNSPSVKRQSLLTNNKPRMASACYTTSGSKCARVDGRAALAPWCCLSMTKEEVVKALPVNREGAFVVRGGEGDAFAMLSMVSGGKLLHYPVMESPEGLHLKKSSTSQPNLSALIAYHKHSSQQGLPSPLVTW